MGTVNGANSRRPWFIARLDKLSRNEDVQAKLQAPDCRWDLVVCDKVFAVKETYEYLDEEWESTAEVLNSTEALKVFLGGW